MLYIALCYENYYLNNEYFFKSIAKFSYFDFSLKVEK